jgi:UDP-N-acetylmuramoylalanine--D-glutamate ligase
MLKNLDFKDKKILILGFGREGKDALLFLRKLFPSKKIGIADQNENCKNLKIQDKNIIWHLGKDYLRAISKYDLIIKSPGIPIHLPEVEKAYKEKKITSATEIFFKFFPGKIIGITGTKGKSTTTYLIYKILKAKLNSVYLVGNIGRPPLKVLLSAKKNSIAVFELSSHQLYNLCYSPHIAVFLNFYPEHLDYYKDVEEYLNAKANITLWQTSEDFLIYNPRNKEVKKVALISKAQKIPLYFPEKIVKECGIQKTKFAGNFYSLNMAAAIKVGEILKIEKKVMKKVIENFKPLYHRLEFVGEFKGIKFYNDSLSTIPETTIFAIRTFKDEIGSLILGGFDRGVSYTKLAKEILKRKIPLLIFFPESGDRIWREILKFSKNKLPKAFLVQSMKDAVKIAFSFTKKGKICLLSPASPSFGLFRNYKERGNLFKKYVKYYGRN